MQIQSPSPVHWTTYVQTFAVIASTIGTFVYVWFTYHIMKWAVGQGKAAMELSRLSVENEVNGRLAALDRVSVFCGRVVKESEELATRYHEMELGEFAVLEGCDVVVLNLLDEVEELMTLLIPRLTRQYLEGLRSMLNGFHHLLYVKRYDENEQALGGRKEAVVKLCARCSKIGFALMQQLRSVDPLAYNASWGNYRPVDFPIQPS